MRKKHGLTALGAVVLLLLLLWSLGPVLVGLATSLSTQRELTQVPAPLWPRHVDLSAYKALLMPDAEASPGVMVTSEVRAFGTAMRNTVAAALGTVVVALVVCILAGYAFNRLSFPGKKLLFALVICTLPVPAFALLAPLFRIISDLGLSGTYAGLILIYISALGPLAIWFFYNFVGDLPLEPEEAAMMDGASRLQAFIHVVLPQMGSGIAALTAILTLSVWGQFLLPLLFAPTLATKPVTVLITEFVGKYNANVPMLSAAGMLALIPPAIVAIVLNRHIRGMLSGWDR
jgi:multiple sugar transport system permease protein